MKFIRNYVGLSVLASYLGDDVSTLSDGRSVPDPPRLVEIWRRFAFPGRRFPVWDQWNVTLPNWQITAMELGGMGHVRWCRKLQKDRKSLELAYLCPINMYIYTPLYRGYAHRVSRSPNGQYERHITVKNVSNSVKYKSKKGEEHI